MRSKLKWFVALFVAFTIQLSFGQTKVITGKVTAEDGPVVGAVVKVAGTNNGVSTNFDGGFSIKAKEGDVLEASYVGMPTKTMTVGASNSVSFNLAGGQGIETVVVTAVNIKTSSNKTTSAMQELKGSTLNVTQGTDLRAALTGKIAGVQNVGQAGSKLGSTGTLRLRGALSLNGQDNDALYVIDGVISSADAIDPENIESINVLKGPNAAALFGSDGINGAVIITTKKGKKGRIKVELFNSSTFDKVAYLPKFQNSYGQGYSGQGSWGNLSYDPSIHPQEYANVPQNVRLNNEGDADESWGPKFDGEPYLPWYAFQKNSPYYGKSQPWSAQENNVKDFYDTGYNIKNGITISGGNESITARVNFTKSTQAGIIPTSSFNKDLIAANFAAKLSDKFNLGLNTSYSKSTSIGDFDDEYGNQLSGSFNAWFGRDLDMSKLRELQGLTNERGYASSWNYWGPDNYGIASYRANDAVYKRVFWHNPFFYLANSQPENKSERLLADLNASYQINKNITVNMIASKNYRTSNLVTKVPFILEYNSAPNLYTDDVNSFGIRTLVQNTNTLQTSIDFNYKLTENLLLKQTFGNIWKDFTSERLNSEMTNSGNILAGVQVGLVIPDLYTFENSRQRVNAQRSSNPYRNNTFYSRTNLDFSTFLSFNLDLMSVYDSRLDYSNLKTSNGVPYGSVGLSFLFSELLKIDKINSARVFASFSKTAPEVTQQLLNPAYTVSITQNYNNNPLQFTPTNYVLPNLQPFSSPSYEIGADLKALSNRLRLNAVYYNETRENQIVTTGISATSGFSNYVSTSGKTTRNGIELVLGLVPFKSDDFTWDATLNFAKNKSIVNSVSPGTNSFEVDVASFNGVSLVNYAGEEWGQLVGNGILKNAAGTPVLNADGLYVTEAGVKFGSVLPQFTLGFYNKFDYKNFTLAGTLSYQNGGKFFSLSERWGTYTGVLEETAELNDRGANVRDLTYNIVSPVVGENGGVRVTGVDILGNTVDTYVEAQTYFKQFHNNNIAENFIHDASFIKLADMSLTYNFSSKVFGKSVQGLSIGVVGRNLFRFGLDKGNKHGWDSSELSKLWGENGQLPGTRSFGLNFKLTF